MSNLDKLKELADYWSVSDIACMPVEEFSDVTGTPLGDARVMFGAASALDGLIEQLEAAEQLVAEITGKYEEVSVWYAKMKTRMLAAEAELARRNAAAGEPVGWQFFDDGAWHNGSNHNNHRENTEKAGYRVRELYAAQPAEGEAVPVWGQARFKGGDWSSCSAEHAAMVMASPEEWGDYECRYLYTTPPAPSAPDGYALVQVADDEVLVALKRIECYEEVDAQILAEDALNSQEIWPEWRVVEVADKPESSSC